MRNFVIGCIVLFTMAGTAFGETKEPPKKLAVDLGGGVKMKLVLIPAGEFKMGSRESAKDTAAFFKTNYGMDYGMDSMVAWDLKDEHPHQGRLYAGSSLWMENDPCPPSSATADRRYTSRASTATINRPTTPAGCTAVSSHIAEA
jgi:hypothetical protein